jgi:DUF1009 family protein
MRNLIRVDPYHSGIQFSYSDGFKLSVKVGPSSHISSEQWMEIAILNDGKFQWLPYDVAQIHVEMMPTLLRAMEQEDAQEIILKMTGQG